MLKISLAGYLGLSPMISTQFTLEMCVAATSREKITKNRYFGVQGRSRFIDVVPPESSSAVLVMISSNSVSICNHSRARLVAEIATSRKCQHCRRRIERTCTPMMPTRHRLRSPRSVHGARPPPGRGRRRTSELEPLPRADTTDPRLQSSHQNKV